MTKLGAAAEHGYYLLHTDGGIKRRLPEAPLTEAAIGVLLRTRHLVHVAHRSRAIGPATHNEAEYRALIAGLKLARRLGIENIRVYTDSETVVDQLNGVRRVREPRLREPRKRAICLGAEFKTFRISWVPRELNVEAHLLVQDALAKVP
jgi:ribonuclease HI